MDAIIDMIGGLGDTLAFTGGLRILLAAAIALGLGIERSVSNKNAGPRTYALVASGSALFTVLSIEAFTGPDNSRVAAQVVTGIGFLGAGLIFRQGISVQGLTSAAGLWSVAAIGMAAGAGYPGLAIVVALIELLVLRGADRLTKRFRSRSLSGAQWSVRLTVAGRETIEDIREIVVSFAPTAAMPLPDIGHWVVGQNKGRPTITLILNDQESNQLLPIFESHEGITKTRIQEIT